MIEKLKNCIAQFPKFTDIIDLLRLRVFYKILFIILVTIIFLGVQAYQNVGMINTIQKTTMTLSGENTYRLRQISQLKQAVSKLQVAYLEMLNGDESASSLDVIILSMKESMVFYWLDETNMETLERHIAIISNLVQAPPSRSGYKALEMGIFDFSMRINEVESLLMSSFIEGLVDNGRFLNQSRRNGIIIVIVSAVCSLFLGLIMVRSIFLPLQKLLDLMKEVSEGNFSARFKENRNDEFGVVMCGFNRMIGNVVEMQQAIREYSADLEQKNIEMERFIYTVSHDLQSPLITIKGFAGSIIVDHTNGKTDRWLSDMRRIEAAASKMQQFLKDLLELSRIGRIINLSSTFSMTEVAEDVVEMLHGLIKNNSVTVSVMKDMPVVRGDRQRIFEVLQNLVENAVKFSGIVQEPQIEIGLIDLEKGPAFFVRDNGPGIAPAYHQKIFGLFNKLENNTDGTGIGLAIVKRVVELHKGKIWVESSLGNGATFYFTLNETEMIG